MEYPLVFFIRCRPQGCDAVDIALKYKRVFIGHPLRIPNTRYDPHALQSCFVDFGSPTAFTTDLAEGWHRQHSANRNIASEAEPGSIALIPRPDRGLVYAATVTARFELVNDPEWYQDYLMLRGEGGVDGDQTAHAADIAQGWQVDCWREISLARIPGWIRRSFGGRSTFGRIYRNDECGEPYRILRSLMENEWQPRDWTVDRAEIKRRLLAELNPQSFEHLMVDLLQLENREQLWLQTGGPGDGGIDGIGYDAETGQVVAVLQCKLSLEGSVDPLTSFSTAARYIATMSNGSACAEPPSFDGERIADLVIKHSERLPFALSLRVGSAKTTVPDAPVA